MSSQRSTRSRTNNATTRTLDVDSHSNPVPEHDPPDTPVFWHIGTCAGERLPGPFETVVA